MDISVESIPAGLWIVDPQGRTEYVNEHMAAMLGYTPQELQGLPLTAVVHEDTHTAASQYLERCQRGLEARAELRLRRKDGAPLWTIASAAAGPGGRRPPTSLLSVVTDISERKRSEDALWNSEARYRVLAETAQDQIFVINRDDRVEYVNRSAAEQLRTVPALLIGRRRQDLFPPDVAERQKSNLDHVFQTQQPLYVEGRTSYLDREVWLGTWLAPIPDADGTVRAVLGVSRDITERRRAEETIRRLQEELSHTQKMEALGRLAGGIAHDFNNNLTAILGFTEMILMQIGDDKPISADLHEIRRAAERAAGLVRRLLAFGRRQILRPQTLDFNEVIDGLRPMLERLVDESTEIVVRLAPDLAAIHGDAGQLEQVVMNLVLNARDAMPRGGTVTIETSNITVSEPGDYGDAVMSPGQYSTMAVRDTGTGMNAQTKERLFEPFFTTKPVGQGTGLGLSTVYGIVKQLNGFIWVESEVGRGSTLTVYFPVVTQGVPAAASSSKRAPTQMAVGRATILLVEDDEAVRRLARMALERHGFRVIEATTPEEALSLAALDDPIDLLLTDLVMPGLSGPELSSRLTATRPTLPILYMSGYPESIVGQDELLDSSVRLLAKPFTTARLLASVEEALRP